MTFSNIVAFMVMAMVTNVSSQMFRQIGQVVSHSSNSESGRGLRCHNIITDLMNESERFVDCKVATQSFTSRSGN